MSSADDENEKPAAPGEAEVRIVSDRETGLVKHITATMQDGSIRVLYPLSPEEIETFEANLEALLATKH